MKTDIEAMEIDLDVAECGEILDSHGVPPTAALVLALWEWAEAINIRCRNDS